VTSPRIVFRTDASLTIGTGHVMRCLTLADALSKRGADVLFVCREHDGNLGDLIVERGFALTRLPVGNGVNRAKDAPPHADWLGASWQEDAEQTHSAMTRASVRPDLLVVDHYALDQRWELALRSAVGRICVIDDLADRHHECDLLLDQSLHDSPETRYSGLVNASARLFVGPRYALLRPEFDDVAIRMRDGGLRRMLIFLGGIDPSNEALKVVSALRALGQETPSATFVLGRANPNARHVHRIAHGSTAINIVDSTAGMAKLMAEADLGVGTCGGAAWERCAVGLPSLVVVNADNQRDDARILHALGAVRNLGDAATTTIERWVDEIRAIKNDPAGLMNMSRAAYAIVRGRKEAMRTLEAALVD
jgi:UDP-2,4-diacetamido-2,4,6-trideoxy-beta-L-altropyranose hydrolase